MKVKLLPLLISCALMAGMLAGCTSSASEQGKDKAKVTVEFATEPATVMAKEAVKLEATVTGLPTQEGAQLAFDIRRPNNKGLPEIIEGQQGKGGSYSADKTFDEPGTYTVYLHLYQGELHETKMKKLVVQ